MKKIEVYYKKSFVIFISVFFFAALIFLLCDIVNTVLTAAKGGKADIGKLIFNVMCLILVVSAVRIFPLRPQVIADENGIAYRCRAGVLTTPWSNVKRIYLTESDELIIEVLNIDSAKSGEKVQIPLSLMEADTLKFTEELQNMLEEYKNAD